jgi:hypothetical protein
MAGLTSAAIEHDSAGGQTPIFIWLLTKKHRLILRTDALD